jgi:hypothetical protein
MPADPSSPTTAQQEVTLMNGQTDRTAPPPAGATPDQPNQWLRAAVIALFGGGRHRIGARPGMKTVDFWLGNGTLASAEATR